MTTLSTWDGPLTSLSSGPGRACGLSRWTDQSVELAFPTGRLERVGDIEQLARGWRAADARSLGDA